MKFILLSDIHATSQTPTLRKDNILETFKIKFEFILQQAQKNNAVILQAGDFFHKSRDWEIMQAIISLLKKYKKTKIYAVMGQHDLYFRSKTAPNILSILNHANYIKRLNNVPCLISDVNIYGCSWKEKIPTPKSGFNILVIHESISDYELFPGSNYMSPRIFVRKNKGWDLILIGDIHRQFIYQKGKTLLINTGPMLRLDANQYNMSHKPAVFIYDTKKGGIIKKIIIPHKKGRIILDRNKIKQENKINKIMNEFAEKLKENDHKKNISFKKNLEHYLKTNRKKQSKIIAIINEYY